MGLNFENGICTYFQIPVYLFLGDHFLWSGWTRKVFKDNDIWNDWTCSRLFNVVGTLFFLMYRVVFLIKSVYCSNFGHFFFDFLAHVADRQTWFRPVETNKGYLLECNIVSLVRKFETPARASSLLTGTCRPIVLLDRCEPGTLCTHRKYPLPLHHERYGRSATATYEQLGIWCFPNRPMFAVSFLILSCELVPFTHYLSCSQLKVCFKIGANAGVVGMTKEHLSLALCLNVPVFIVVTKIDMCPEQVMFETQKIKAFSVCYSGREAEALDW